MNFSSILKHRELIWEMALRDLKGVNQGAFIGYFWLLLGPLIQVAAYVFIVSFIFERSLSEDSGPLDYAVYVLSGMVPWQIITRSLQSAPSLIRERMELVKQVIYPIETLPLTNLIVASIGAVISFVVYLVLTLLNSGVGIGYLLLPIPVTLLVVFVMGISWIFSIVGVLFKDLREIVAVLLGLMVYISPVITSETMVSPQLWTLIQLNPLSHIVICFRDVFNAEFHASSWVIFTILALVSALLGGWIINRAKLLINEYI